MQKFSRQRKRLERLQYRLAVAGNGLFLVGSVLYVSESSMVLGTWAFVAGSSIALLATLLPQMIQSWFCPADEEPHSPPLLPRPLAAAA